MHLKLSYFLACFVVATDARFFGNTTQTKLSITNSYIIVYKPNVGSNGVGSVRSWATSSFNAQIRKTNIAGSLDMNVDVVDLSKYPQGAEKAAELLAKHPQIASVEKDQRVTIQIQNQPNPASWGLDRIDQRYLPLNGNYQYDDLAGAGVKVYVVDTGIKIDNPEFEGRAKWGADFTGEGLFDGNGHGTHCAGTVAGKNYGVAKKAEIIAVKVLFSEGWGTWSDIIAGVNWVATNCGGQKCIMSMSLGGWFSGVVNNAVQNAYRKGVVPVVAAGNSADNACLYSPASTLMAVTVGATDPSDRPAWFSNYGMCVDIHAPGVDITSVTTCDNGTTDCFGTWSGTSMATPHVAGVAALLWAKEASVLKSPAQVISRIKGLGTPGVVQNIARLTPNLLAYSGN